ncbi:LSm family protein [Paenibacillus aestuarii]|uniref:DUF2642 domain-containing protein n=1 Tax=Paenibacillus aestuarii TaxID=516965 RepID=A0ABW0KBL1_9BACL|nr:hypothetical protein [Paenibacillus aestuarii]
MYTHPSYPLGHHGPQTIYQADPSWMPLLKQKRDQIYGALHPHVGHTIRVTTVDGHTYEGTLVNVDGHHAYLQVHSHGHQHGGQHRPIYTPAQYNQILTLVLFELLVIVLLSM